MKNENPNTAEKLIAAIDDMLKKCGYVIHDERRISIEMFRDQVLIDKEMAMANFQLWTKIRNLRNKVSEKHRALHRSANEAHQARLEAVGMGR